MSRLLQSVLLVPGLLAAGLIVAWASPAEARRCPPGTYMSGGRCVRAGRVGPRHVAPRHVAPRHVAPRHVGPRHVAPRHVAPRHQVCPAGFYRDAYGRCIRNTGHIVRHRGCGVGFYRDAYGRCIRNTGHVVRHRGCGVGYYRDAYGRCIRTGATYIGGAATCGVGWRWSPYYKRCVVARTCPPGTHWNGYSCRSWRQCAPGQYWSRVFNSCRVAYTNCPYGYSYRAGWGCQPICPSGWYFNAGQCYRAATACPSGTYWNVVLNRCRPACGPGRYWSYKHQRCRRVRW